MRFKSKYGAKKTEIDGIKFDSKKEGKRYLELKEMLKNNKISDLELQPRFLLQDKFKHGGKTIRKIEYVADFKYKTGTDTIVEDVKGFKTDVYNIKKKIFLFNYGDKYIFREI